MSPFDVELDSFNRFDVWHESPFDTGTHVHVDDIALIRVEGKRTLVVIFEDEENLNRFSCFVNDRVQDICEVSKDRVLFLFEYTEFIDKRVGDSVHPRGFGKIVGESLNQFSRDQIRHNESRITCMSDCMSRVHLTTIQEKTTCRDTASP